MAPRRKLERTRPTGQQLPTLKPTVEAVNIGAPSTPAPPQARKAVESPTLSVTDSGTPEVPKWRQLVRKELRVREDQAAALAALRRRVAAARTSKDEPITDNTLVRIAIDLLLANADRLAGDTEDELRDSVIH